MKAAVLGLQSLCKRRSASSSVVYSAIQCEAYSVLCYQVPEAGSEQEADAVVEERRGVAGE